MLYILGVLFLTVLAIFGVVHLVGEFIFKLTSIKNQDIFIIVSITKQNENNAEYILRGTAARMKWIGKNFSSKIICVDNGISDEARKICETVCAEYDFIEILSPAEVSKLFKN